MEVYQKKCVLKNGEIKYYEYTRPRTAITPVGEKQVRKKPHGSINELRDICKGMSVDEIELVKKYARELIANQNHT